MNKVRFFIMAMLLFFVNVTVTKQLSDKEKKEVVAQLFHEMVGQRLLLDMALPCYEKMFRDPISVEKFVRLYEEVTECIEAHEAESQEEIALKCAQQLKKLERFQEALRETLLDCLKGRSLISKVSFSLKNKDK